MDISETKEVYFGEYCKTCKHRDLPEDEDPCFDCLAEPVNLYSHKPVRWTENKKTNSKGE